jgi:site-specific DNA-methyltransferase (adenine-specific)
MPNSIAENRDCMNAMLDFPDKYFELAIVDPPYGIGAQEGFGKWQSKKFRKSGKDWDSTIPNFEYFEEVRRLSKNQVIWGGNYFGLPASRCWIVWHKGAGMQGRTYAGAELAWTSFDANTAIFEYDALANQDFKARIHPTQKPVALYKWLLSNYAKPGDKILDTHLGSGSSRIAAWDMGFDFWGYELDADYFAAMEARFKAHVSKPVLFAPDEMYNFEQGKLF